MTIKELYEFSIEKGMELDPRGPEELTHHLKEVLEAYEGLDEMGKRLFDTERLHNPFGDTRIVTGSEDTQVRRLVCGIDITGSEILMADRLRDLGRPVDLVLAHHTTPIGGGLGSRYDTIWPQVRMLTDFGVPRHRAEKLIRANAEGPQRSANYQANQVAEALGMPLMTIHSPADVYLLQEGWQILREDHPETVGDLIDICNAWPEVQWSIERGLGTEAAVGSRHDPLGQVYPCLYGGWNPTPEVVEALCQAGCGTLWVVATSEDLNHIARTNHMNIVVIPHGPADARGLNGLLDDAMKRFGSFDIVPCSNYNRGTV
ncbi:MAG: hypothetical protein IT210_12105 [Armatimonadetes bacterium]|nr:hypothetical protein [Armatimonadota bacterium]